MKKLIVMTALLIASTAMAGIESEIEKAINRLKLPKTGVGSHNHNGVTASTDRKCSVALDRMGAFEITVGGTTTGTNIKGWDKIATSWVDRVDYDRFFYSVDGIRTNDGCILEQDFGFSAKSVWFSQGKKCPLASKNWSEFMKCNY